MRGAGRRLIIFAGTAAALPSAALAAPLLEPTIDSASSIGASDAGSGQPPASPADATPPTATGDGTQAAVQPATSAPGDLSQTPSVATPVATGDTGDGSQTPPANVWAEAISNSNLVLTRARPGLAPQGFPVGGFTLYPTLAVTAGYDDNVFATSGNRQSSTFFTIVPSMVLTSNPGLNQYTLSADGTLQRYTSVPIANYDAFNIKADGLVNLTSSLAMRLDGHYAQSAEARGTIGDLSIDGEPIVYHTAGGSIAAFLGNGPIQLSLGGSYDHLAYDDARIGDIILQQGYRDHSAYAVTGKAGLEVGPGILAFISGEYAKDVYDLRASRAIFNSQGGEALAGLDFKITRLIRGRIGIGYIQRSYRFASYPNVHGFDYDASIVWNLTTLFTLTAKAAKTIQESPIIGSSGVLTSTFSLESDWEILRKLLFAGSVTYVREHYQALDSGDHRVTAGAGLQYLMNRNLELGLKYAFATQDGSGLAGRSYRDNAISFTITVQR